MKVHTGSRKALQRARMRHIQAAMEERNRACERRVNIYRLKRVKRARSASSISWRAASYSQRMTGVAILLAGYGAGCGICSLARPRWSPWFSHASGSRRQHVFVERADHDEHTIAATVQGFDGLLKAGHCSESSRSGKEKTFVLPACSMAPHSDGWSAGAAV